MSAEGATINAVIAPFTPFGAFFLTGRLSSHEDMEVENRRQLRSFTQYYLILSTGTFLLGVTTMTTIQFDFLFTQYHNSRESSF